jgi:hypothetical protein
VKPDKEKGRDVGAHPEIEGMAEGELSGIASDHVPGLGKDAVEKQHENHVMKERVFEKDWKEKKEDPDDDENIMVPFHDCPPPKRP